MNTEGYTQLSTGDWICSICRKAVAISQLDEHSRKHEWLANYRNEQLRRETHPESYDHILLTTPEVALVHSYLPEAGLVALDTGSGTEFTVLPGYADGKTKKLTSTALDTIMIRMHEAELAARVGVEEEPCCWCSFCSAAAKRKSVEEARKGTRW